MQPSFKLRKPPNLQHFQQEIIVENEIPELDTFEEFCSNIPDQDNQDVNFSKHSNNPHLSNFHQNQSIQSKSSILQQSGLTNQQSIQQSENPEDDIQIEYMEFVEFNPQSAVSESTNQRIDTQQSQKDTISEPPAPQNKNTNKFCFPSKGQGFNNLKKQLGMNQEPLIQKGNQSNSEQTVLKNQSHIENKLHGTIEDDLKKQIQLLTQENQDMQKEFQFQISQLIMQNQLLETQLQEQLKINTQINQDKLILISKIETLQSKYMNDQKNIPDSNTFTESVHCKLTNTEKIQYLISKLNQKCQENAKLQYEIIVLQNNIEILETQKFLQLNSNNIFSLDTGKIPNLSSSPPPQSQNRGQSLSKDSRNSLLTQQKQPLNLTINYPTEGKNHINLSAMISPLSKCAQIIQQKAEIQKLQKNKQQFQEDVQIQKIHTKNSTSVGELMAIKSDTINYSNIINRILRKESYSISSPDGRAAQKFKQALNEKLSHLQQDNSKSYGSLLFSHGEQKQRDLASLRQVSPKREKKKSKQLFGFINQQNSRKQSDLLKSEESHRSDIGRFSEKKSSNQQNAEILQIMKEIQSRKSGSNFYSQLVSKNLKQNQNVQLIRPLITDVKSTRNAQQLQF